MRGERNKDLRPRLNLPKELHHIPHHTDDFAPSVLVPVSKIQSDVASNWVFPAKEAPGECLVDDHHGRRNIRRSEEHTSELQSHSDLVCRLLLEKKKKKTAELEPNIAKE